MGPNTDGLAEEVVDLSLFGELRAAKTAEFVLLEGTFTPVPATGVVQIADVVFTIHDWLDENDHPRDCLLKRGTVLTAGTKKCKIPLTGSAALLLLETGEIRVFSASPDRAIGKITMSIVMLDARGQPCPAGDHCGKFRPQKGGVFRGSFGAAVEVGHSAISCWSRMEVLGACEAERREPPRRARARQ